MADNERGDRLMRALDRWIGCPMILLLGVLHSRKPRPAEIREIGVLMFGAIGDALLSSAIIGDLRRAFPAARITAFVSASNKGTLDLLEGPHTVMVAPIKRPHVVISMIRRCRFDVLIDIGQWPRISAIVAALAGARFTVGFKTRGQFRHHAFDAVAEHSNARHEIDNFRALLAPLDVKGHCLPRFKPDLLEAPAPERAGPYVVFHPWASGYRSHLREWAVENWVALARVVLSRGYRILMTGGPQDAQRSESLAAQIGRESQVTVLAGRADLRKTTVALLHAAAVVSVNTGIMHLAALLNRPTLALHGPTNPRRWGPLGSGAVVIGPGPEQGGAYLNLGFEYPPTPPDCMSQITPEQVAARLGEMLGWRREMASRTA
jgi:ADP-heptose:LPS heptosyltransferase